MHGPTMLNVERVTTPFGDATIDVVNRGGMRAAIVDRRQECAYDRAAIRAAVYGVKLLGVSRIVDVLPSRGIDRLLPREGYAVPHDLVDLTHGDYLTFFEGKGYGFLPQQEPFCPELGAALVGALRAIAPMTAARGVLAAVDDVGMYDAAEHWGAQMLARGASPAAFLARELEVCYTPLCVFGEPRGAIETIAMDLLAALPEERSCVCATAMQATRQRGLVGDKWQEWL